LFKLNGWYEVIIGWMILMVTTVAIGHAISNKKFNANFTGPYQAIVIKVIDADTIKMEVLIWPNLFTETNVRVHGIDTPETTWRAKSECEKQDGRAATEFVKEFLKGKQIMITNVKLGKYAGRVIANITVGGKDLSALLLETNYAVPYFGGKKLKWICKK